MRIPGNKNELALESAHWPEIRRCSVDHSRFRLDRKLAGKLRKSWTTNAATT
jgi:hypothetical protein